VIAIAARGLFATSESVAATGRFAAAGWALATFGFYAFASDTFLARGILHAALTPEQLTRLGVLVALAILAAVGSAAIIARRGEPRLVAASYRAGLLVPLGVVPLYQAAVGLGQFFAILVVTVTFGWTLWLFAQRCPEGIAIEGLDARPSAARIGGAVVFVLAVVNSYALANAAVEKCLALGGGWDLMIHNSLHYNIVTTGRAWTTGLWFFPVDHYGNHFAPIEHLSAIVYAFHRTPETLVTLQAIMISFAALPVYGIARRLTGSATVGVFIAASFGINACITAVCLYDFHEAAFLVPTLLSLVWACVADKKRLVVLFALLALNSREDGGLWVALFGAIWWSRGKRTGLHLAFAGAVTLVLVNFVVMPWIRKNTGQPVWLTDRYSGISRGGTVGVGATAISAATNPGFVLSYVLSYAEKWRFLALVLWPVVLLPLRTMRGVLLVGPPIAFSVLANFGAMYTIDFHYTVQIMPFLYLATALGLERFERRTAIVLAATAFVATALVSGRFSRHPIVNARTFEREMGELRAEYGERAALYRRMAFDVPHDGCAMGNDAIVTPLSSRKLAYKYPTGTHCEYAFINVGKRMRELDEEHTPPLRAWLFERLRNGTYGVMYADERVVLVGKGRPTDRNAEVLAHFEALQREEDASRR
jgi:uncharacterized membrane protein